MWRADLPDFTAISMACTLFTIQIAEKLGLSSFFGAWHRAC